MPIKVEMLPWKTWTTPQMFHKILKIFQNQGDLRGQLQEILIKYRLSLSFCVADLVAFYECNILDPAGSLLSAIYLQGNAKSKYPKLDPNCKDPLILWIFRCANFGYSDSSALSYTVKNLVSKFY